MNTIEKQTFRLSLIENGMAEKAADETMRLMDNAARLKAWKGSPIGSVIREDSDVEVYLAAEYFKAEPDVGIMSGGVAVESVAVRTDTGEEVELTRVEQDQFELELAEESSERDDGDDYDLGEDR